MDNPKDTDRKAIVVIGSTNVDFIMRVGHLPALGETVTDGEFRQVFGGKGANQAVAVARSGDNSTVCRFITCLGDDSYAETIRANFAKDGMDIEHIRTAAGVPTGSALVMFDGGGNNYLTVAPGSNYRLTAAHIDEDTDIIANAAMIVMQMEIEPETIDRALAIATDHNVPVLFNYAPVKAMQIRVDGRIHGLIVNEIEAEVLSGQTVNNHESAQAAAQILIGKGVGFVVVTLGADGAFVVSPDFTGPVPGFPVTPVDTTAAGDTFCGALAVGLTEGKTMQEAVRFASAAAAISVTRMGAQPSVPYRGEIETFLMERTDTQ